MLPLWDDAPRRGSAVVTRLLIVVNLVIFIYEITLSLDGERRLSAFLIEHSLVPQRLLSGWTDGGQWLTVLTSMFLHGSIFHVVGNCWFLWVFGKAVEGRFGSVRYLVLYLLAGVGAAAFQAGLSLYSPLPMLGASGAISGVLGAYLALFPSVWVFTLVPWVVPVVPLPAFVLLIVWFALQAFNGVGSLVADATAQGGVAWWAHIGGFLTGLIITIWLKHNGSLRRR